MVQPSPTDNTTAPTSVRPGSLSESQRCDGAPRKDGLLDEESAGLAQAQTIWILIFTGRPRDIQSARVTELYIAFNEDESANVTISLQGQHPNFVVHETWNQPPPRRRQNFHRRLAISTIVTRGSEPDMSVRDAIWSTPVNNAEPDWSCQSWVGDVVTVLQEADLITAEEGDNALNGMVNYISQAPWR
ncbi:hypothetical protein F5Y16DRAFT_372339 [Xylariaceae sp. FL0255]|nr:hypothetical protein F5Y16DRAFT_372339 [Xylariaceae sp. FL0255]